MSSWQWKGFEFFWESYYNIRSICFICINHSFCIWKTFL